MTIGNDTAQPNPTDQPVPVVADATDTAAQAAVIAEAAARMQDDPDLIELNAAKAAEKAEETAKAAAKGSDKVEGTPLAPTPPAVSASFKAPAQAAPVPMIPKPRFDEVNAARSKAEQDAAYWQGVANARAQPAPAPGAQTAPQPQPKPQDRLAAIHSAQDELADKFDAGEITMKDLTAQQRSLNDQEAQVRQDMLPKAAAPATQSGNELYLDTLTAGLETKHPWVEIFDQAGSDADWAYLKATAIDRLTEKGIDPTKGDIGRFELRRAMAELADELGPGLIAAKAQAKGIVLPGHTPSPQRQQQAPARTETAAARAAKLALQANSPPNLNAMRGAGEDAGMPSASRIETMTDDEIGALPTSVRNKILGITSA